MDGENNVINFKWERLKHRFRYVVYNTKQSIADFFAGNVNSHAHDNHKGKGRKAAVRKRNLKNI